MGTKSVVRDPTTRSSGKGNQECGQRSHTEEQCNKGTRSVVKDLTLRSSGKRNQECGQRSHIEEQCDDIVYLSCSHLRPGFDVVKIVDTWSAPLSLAFHSSLQYVFHQRAFTSACVPKES
ncbi:hypothetical protein PoB_007072500 [Plakobranchus ocellatus]|uniref:Uncharacterized protein n=1 Tax=Plakobranchus ocellatus TaxID=259542 RepID=A0AAV4DJN4_9GAST|nr:hypothetical protein PoB_007072500 [Plakobranchus ocellatus]